MNYEQTLHYLYSSLPMYQRIGKAAFKKDLGNIIKLCEAIGQPHLKFKSIHIAGTNGKGTTSNLLSSVFQSHGLKTGLYTSPHYKDFRERIKIDGQYIPQKDVVQFVQKHKEIFEKIKPSFFEITVAMAFNYFAEQKVDIAIIETGLGGRLDSTNIILPELCAITNISLDHTHMLGNTIKEIAGEKAGIIKKDIPVIIGERGKEADAVFYEHASLNHAPISFAEDLFSYELKHENLEHYILDLYFDGKLIIESLEINLKGKFLLKNMLTCLETLRIWNKTHRTERISEGEIRNGFKDLRKLTNYVGRWHILNKKPLIIGDSAHNPGAFEMLFEEINKLSKNRLHIVLGVVEDKDLEKSLPFFPKNAHYYFAQANVPRAKDAEKLCLESKEYGLIGDSHASVESALAAAKKIAKEKDLILICGSIFNLAEIL